MKIMINIIVQEIRFLKNLGYTDQLLWHASLVFINVTILGVLILILPCGILASHISPASG